MQTFELEKHLIILGKHISLQATDPTNPRAVFPLGLGGKKRGWRCGGGGVGAETYLCLKRSCLLKLDLEKMVTPFNMGLCTAVHIVSYVIF